MKILIVEDEVLIAAMLEEVLFDLGYKEITIAKMKLDAQNRLLNEEVDLAILDINLEGNNEGLELGRLCMSKQIPYFFLTSFSDRDTIIEAKQSKPGNYVIKPFSPEEIVVAIELSLMHSKSEEKSNFSKVAKAFNLSAREAEILELLINRLSNQEISEKLFLSLNTIKYHIRHIYSKVGASTRQELLERVKYVSSQV